MSESPYAALGDYVDIVTGFPFASRSYGRTGIRLLRGDNIVQGRLRWDGVKYWPDELLLGHEQFHLAVGDVVLAMDRPWIEAGLKYAAIVEADLPCLLVQRVARLRAMAGLDQRFLQHLIASPDFTRHVLSVQTGTAVPHISARQIREFRFRFMPVLDQQKIAEVLGALSDKIDHNRRLAAKCERLAVELISSVAARRPISEFSTASRDQLRPEQFASEPVEHFSLPAFDEQRMPDRCSGATIKSSKFRVNGPSVLVSKLNPHIPRVWYAEPPADQLAVASTEFVVLKPNGVCRPTVLWAALAAPTVISALNERVTGTTGSHQRVKPQDVLDTLAPDITVVADSVLEFVDGVVRRALAARRENQSLKKARDELLRPLLLGELKVSDAEPLVGEAV